MVFCCLTGWRFRCIARGIYPSIEEVTRAVYDTHMVWCLAGYTESEDRDCIPLHHSLMDNASRNMTCHFD